MKKTGSEDWSCLFVGREKAVDLLNFLIYLLLNCFPWHIVYTTTFLKRIKKGLASQHSIEEGVLT